MTINTVYKKKSNPRISLVMSVYNGEKYLRESVESILGQSFGDFEFIIVNDGSTDYTLEILRSYQDERIVLIDNPGNIGLTRSLNLALQICRGKYIARQDADDISVASRLETQLKYLEENTEVGVLGTQMEIIDQSGEVTNRYELPLYNSMIAWSLFFDRSIAHPTVMMRKALIDRSGGYDSSLRCAQDVELWARLAIVTRLRNLQEPLYLYRERLDSVSRTRSGDQLSAVMIARQRLASTLLDRDVPIILLKELHACQRTGGQIDEETAKEVLALMLDLYNAMTDRGIIAGEGSEQVRQDMLRRVKVVAERASTNSGSEPDLKPLPRYLQLGLKAVTNPRKAYYVAREIVRNQTNRILSPNRTALKPAMITPSKGITLIILSYERMTSLAAVLKSLLKQDLGDIQLEIIICNNSSRVDLKSSRYSTVGRLLGEFPNLKIFNSSYNWKCQVRYGITTLAYYDTIMFLDDDIIIVDRDFIRYMFETLHSLKPFDIVSCWNTLWVGLDDEALEYVQLTFETEGITEIIQSDTIGCGISMFNKEIVLSKRLMNMFRDSGRADDMTFPIVANLEWGSKSYFLPSYGMLKIHDQGKIAALNAVPGHYSDLYTKYKELVKDGYNPVILGPSHQCVDEDSPARRAARRLAVRSYRWEQS